MKHFTFIILFSLMFFMTGHEEHPKDNFVPKKNITIKRVLPTLERQPAQIPSRARTVSPEQYKDSFSLAPEIYAGNGWQVTKDLGAVSIKDYAPHLGEVVSQNRDWVFYKKSTQQTAIPVAYSPSKNEFAPLSTVVTIARVTPEMRERILSSGHTEHFYQERARLLFIESTSADLLHVYQELKAQGLKVQLEVLDQPFIPR